MRISVFAIVVCILFCLSFGGVCYLYFSQPKIGFVNSFELVDGYLGMKEARNKYHNKLQIKQANVDTLGNELQKSIEQYQLTMSRLSPVERKAKETELRQREKSFLQYSNAIRKQAEEEDKQVTQGVLNQINSFVKQYGEKHNYEVILGTTLSGSLLYGRDSNDLTKEILLELNKFYRPGIEQYTPPDSLKQ